MKKIRAMASVLLAGLVGAMTASANGDYNFTRLETVSFPGETITDVGGVDPANGFAYYGVHLTGHLDSNGQNVLTPGKIVKIRMSDSTRVGALNLELEDGSPSRNAFIDTVSGFAYFITTSQRMVKIRLSDFSRVGHYNIQQAGDFPVPGNAIDAAAGYAYIAEVTAREGTTPPTPSRIVKVRLSDLSRVAVLNLESGEDFTWGAAIDPAGGFAYFSASGNKVIKIRLSDFTRVAALTFPEFVTRGFIDPPKGFAYFMMAGPPSRIVRIRLSDFTKAGEVAFLPEEGPLDGAAIYDAASGHAYVGVARGTKPGGIVKFCLDEMTRDGILELNTGEFQPTGPVFNPLTGFAYYHIYAYQKPPYLVKFDLSPIHKNDVAHPKDSPKVFPNPFRPSKGHKTANFSHLPANAQVRIYNQAGKEVQTLNADSYGSLSWDGRGRSGESVISGIYFIQVNGLSGANALKLGIE